MKILKNDEIGIKKSIHNSRKVGPMENWIEYSYFTGNDSFESRHQFFPIDILNGGYFLPGRVLERKNENNEKGKNQNRIILNKDKI